MRVTLYLCVLVSCKLGDCAFGVGCEAVVSVTLGVAGVLE